MNYCFSLIFPLGVILILLFVIIIVVKNWITFTGLDNSLYEYQPHELNDIISIPDKSYLKIMSYNFYLQSMVMFDDYKYNDCKEERFNHFIKTHSKTFDEHDIICFQEVYGTLSLYCNKIIEYAKHKEFHWFIVPEKPKFFSIKMMDSGLLILSKYPIIYANTVPFQSGLIKDRFAQKSFQYCIIDTFKKDNKKYLHLINTHLQSEYKLKDDDTMEVKYQQLQQIRNFIDFYKLRNDNLLICGDFNINCNYYDHSYEVVTGMYSKEYYKMLLILGMSVNNDVEHHYTDKTSTKYQNKRNPSLYCTYDTLTGKELDTRYRPYYKPHFRNNGTNITKYNMFKINLERCVDYILFSPCSSMTIRNTKTKQFECETRDISLSKCSDHNAITTEIHL